MLCFFLGVVAGAGALGWGTVATVVCMVSPVVGSGDGESFDVVGGECRDLEDFPNGLLAPTGLRVASCFVLGIVT